MGFCDWCCAEVPATGGCTATDGVTEERFEFCSAAHVHEWQDQKLHLRGVESLESIAASLDKLANPVRTSKPMPPGMAKCTKCPAVVPIGKIAQHHQEVHS